VLLGADGNGARTSRCNAVAATPRSTRPPFKSCATPVASSRSRSRSPAASASCVSPRMALRNRARKR
jgi:hypothetical protein